MMLILFGHYQGILPLVVEVHSADVMASLIELKKEVEASLGKPLKMTFLGASEAHILAREIGAAGVGVVINPLRPYPMSWEMKRMHASC